mmetsp:Transcript_3590/g.8551  ORF Transcript_3590/g.8551 Transcript_3590/m.8551 type:complete len:923 (+) Transcript_3590:592-3360(+)
MPLAGACSNPEVAVGHFGATHCGAPAYHHQVAEAESSPGGLFWGWLLGKDQVGVLGGTDSVEEARTKKETNLRNKDPSMFGTIFAASGPPHTSTAQMVELLGTTYCCFVEAIEWRNGELTLQFTVQGDTSDRGAERDSGATAAPRATTTRTSNSNTGATSATRSGSGTHSRFVLTGGPRNSNVNVSSTSTTSGSEHQLASSPTTTAISLSSSDMQPLMRSLNAPVHTGRILTPFGEKTATRFLQRKFLRKKCEDGDTIKEVLEGTLIFDVSEREIARNQHALKGGLLGTPGADDFELQEQLNASSTDDQYSNDEIKEERIVAAPRLRPGNTTNTAVSSHPPSASQKTTNDQQRFPEADAKFRRENAMGLTGGGARTGGFYFFEYGPGWTLLNLDGYLHVRTATRKGPSVALATLLPGATSATSIAASATLSRAPNTLSQDFSFSPGAREPRSSFTAPGPQAPCPGTSAPPGQNSMCYDVPLPNRQSTVRILDVFRSGSRGLSLLCLFTFSGTKFNSTRDYTKFDFLENTLKKSCSLCVYTEAVTTGSPSPPTSTTTTDRSFLTDVSHFTDSLARTTPLKVFTVRSVRMYDGNINAEDSRQKEIVSSSSVKGGSAKGSGGATTTCVAHLTFSLFPASSVIQNDEQAAHANNSEDGDSETVSGVTTFSSNGQLDEVVDSHNLICAGVTSPSSQRGGIVDPFGAYLSFFLKFTGTAVNGLTLPVQIPLDRYYLTSVNSGEGTRAGSRDECRFLLYRALDEAGLLANIFAATASPGTGGAGGGARSSYHLEVATLPQLGDAGSQQLLNRPASVRRVFSTTSPFRAPAFASVFKKGSAKVDDVEQLKKLSGNSSSLGMKNNLLSSKNANKEKCVICLTEKANATFVHAPTGHQVCCMGCALKIWNSRTPVCPVCREPVQCVIQTYVA